MFEPLYFGGFIIATKITLSKQKMNHLVFLYLNDSLKIFEDLARKPVSSFLGYRY